MKTVYLFSRIYNKEEYKFFLNEPEYEGEKGVLGITLTPYVSVETPDNGFGYPDTILLSEGNGKAYTLHRYLPPWILKKIEKRMKSFMEVYYEKR